jgi:hypothetical protein
MRARPLLIVVIAAFSCGVILAQAQAGRQSVALVPPQPVGIEEGQGLSELLARSLAENLKDRFDVHLVEGEAGNDPGLWKRRARFLGATYLLTGTVSRIGRTATLDLTLAPTEEPGKGRTVFITAGEGSFPEGSTGAGSPGELPPAYRKMAVEASAKLKLLFFGDGKIDDGGAGRKIPPLTGKVSLSKNIPGEVISLAWGDTDRNGKTEVVAALPDSLVIYQLAGEDLVEKSRVPAAEEGVFHVDVADLNRDGIADIVVVRYLSGRAVSDVWEFDGKQYRRIAGDIPLFLRTADLGPEGVVLLGQESDPVTIFKGPVFRISPGRFRERDFSGRSAPLPLPAGTWIYSFVPVRYGGGMRFVSLEEGGRLRLIDGKGEKLWESIDAVSGTGLSLDAAVAELPGPPGEHVGRRLFLPGRLFAADLDGDKNDEIVVVNNIVSAGGFFENLRIYTNSEVLCFGQRSDSLELVWRTPQLESPAMDAFLDIRPGGKSPRIAVASRDKTKILGKFGEWRLYWVK